MSDKTRGLKTKFRRDLNTKLRRKDDAIVRRTRSKFDIAI